MDEVSYNLNNGKCLTYNLQPGWGADPSIDHVLCHTAVVGNVLGSNLEYLSIIKLERG